MGSEDHTEDGYSSPFWGISLIDWMLATVQVQSVRGELGPLDLLPWQRWLGLLSSGSVQVESSQCALESPGKLLKLTMLGSYSRAIKSQCLGVGTASGFFFFFKISR